MKYDAFIQQFSAAPWVETQDVGVWSDKPLRYIQIRLSQWVREGKLIQLRRGKYLLPAAYRRQQPSNFTLSNQLYRPSYVSMESALAFYGMIPETVPVVQCITTRLTKKWQTPIGSFAFYNMKQDRFFGYKLVPFTATESFYCATPEKALADLFYMKKGDWPETRILELRLQNPEKINMKKLKKVGKTMGSKKVMKAIDTLIEVENQL
ncbi:MAG: hypothetical protein U9N31_03860 [Candidatus Marinimicrobia bacterium]|nr:hypothetical protein [Candidatus Neomarinimicrobiota bacterium]